MRNGKYMSNVFNRFSEVYFKVSRWENFCIGDCGFFVLGKGRKGSDMIVGFDFKL